MAKIKQSSKLAARSAAALTLTAALAAFGCTTNRTPGNGDPLSGPAVGGVAPAAAPNTGSSGGTTPVPPPGSASRLVSSPEEAARIMSQHEPLRGKVLGPVDPVPTAHRGATPPTGQPINPAVLTNPQLTVNSTISSPGSPAIVSGAGEPLGGTPVVGAVTDTLTSAASGGGVALGGGTGAVTQGVTIAPAGTIAPAPATIATPAAGALNPSPTAAAIPAGPGAFAGTGGMVAPAAGPGLAAATAATAATPTPTGAAAATPVTAASAPVASTPATASVPFGGRAAALSTAPGAGSTSVRVVTDQTGNVVVSNQNQTRTSRFGRLLRALRPGGRPAAPPAGETTPQP